MWFFTQNIPANFDDRILGYLPKTIRAEWDKQRTFIEQEAIADTVPESESVVDTLVVETESEPVVETTTSEHFFEVNDLVEIPEGKVGHITEIHFDIKLGRVAAVSVPGGAVQCPVNDLRYIGKYQKPVTTETTEPASEPAKSPAKSKKIKKSKVTPADILKCQTYAEIRAIAGNDPQLIKDAAVSAKTKAEKDLIEKLPEMIRDYMYENRNFDDFDWLPTYVVQRVRSLFREPGTPTAA